MSTTDKVRKLILIHTDDYRAGPHLYINDGDYKDHDDAYNVEFAVKNNKYIVYQLSLDCGDYDLKSLREFEKINNAISYSKQQYYLYTGNYPFIIDGYTSSYKATGTRPEINVDDGMKCEIDNSDGIDYIVIINDDHFEAHSLNLFAEW